MKNLNFHTVLDICPSYKNFSFHNEFLVKGLKSKMIISLHDELVFEICKIELRIVFAFVADMMENTVKLSVPLKVDFKIGKYLDGEIQL